MHFFTKHNDVHSRHIINKAGKYLVMKFLPFVVKEHAFLYILSDYLSFSKTQCTKIQARRSSIVFADLCKGIRAEVKVKTVGQMSL